MKRNSEIKLAVCIVTNYLAKLDTGLSLYKSREWPKCRTSFRGEMVITVGNGPGDSSSNPGLGFLHFL